MADTTVILTPTTAPTSGTTSIPHADRMTVDDALERTIDYFGGNASKMVKTNARVAILDGLREVQTGADWTYLWNTGRINLDAPYTTGTIAFDLTGGTHERMVTLTSGTWPSWAAFGIMRISGTGVSSGGSVVYQVDRRISDTIITLTEETAPVADIAAGTSYTLSRDEYAMPVDFINSDNMLIEDNWGGMVYIDQQDWFTRRRYIHDSFGQPIYYTFKGHTKIPGRLAVHISPPADTAQTLDFMYKRKPREIKIWRYTTGNITVDSVNTPRRLTLAGGGAFTRDMVGSVVRLSSDSTTIPTARWGEDPYAVERNIEVFVSSTVVEVDEDIQDDYTGVAYIISDPIDFDALYLNAFARSVERQGVVQRIMKNQRNANNEYFLALRLAAEADARVAAKRTAGLSRPYRQRLADMPRGPDIS